MVVVQIQHRLHTVRLPSPGGGVAQVFGERKGHVLNPAPNCYFSYQDGGTLQNGHGRKKSLRYSWRNKQNVKINGIQHKNDGVHIFVFVFHVLMPQSRNF